MSVENQKLTRDKKCLVRLVKMSDFRFQKTAAGRRIVEETAGWQKAPSAARSRIIRASRLAWAEKMRVS